LSLEGSFLYILAVSGAVGGISVGAFPFYLQNQITNKKADIERQIPYALAFMSILASSGETPLDVIRRVALEDYGHISREFGKVIFRVDILGEDAISAMNDLVLHTPSEIFRTICIDITNIMHGGGGLTQYLATKSRDLMALRRQAYREFVESLSVFAEGYLGGVVMTITLGVLGIIISGALSIQLGPFTPGQLLMLLIYAVTPIINIIFLQVLSVKYSTNP
jgi:flagellar protein FlaJ